MSEQNSSNNGSAALDEASAYAALSRIVRADRPVGEVLEEVALLAKRVLPETPEVSVTLLSGGHAETAAFTGPLAIHLDERQYEKGFGPCLDAAVSGEKVPLAMADPDNPYPDFAAIARRQGVTHSLSVGLPVATPTVGALNLYSSTGRPFSDDAIRIVGMFASFAAIVVTSARLHADLADLAGQLKTAMRSRAVIDQAKGIIMAQNRCTDQDAFEVLVRTSQNRNVKLRLLAEQLVAGVAHPTDVNKMRPRTLS